jgi:hypothetical protein
VLQNGRLNRSQANISFRRIERQKVSLRKISLYSQQINSR